jgi:DNA-binding PadR family transcriptional regulator
MTELLSLGEGMILLIDRSSFPVPRSAFRVLVPGSQRRTRNEERGTWNVERRTLFSLDITSTLWNKPTMSSALGEFEQLVLLAVVRLGPEAYGATIRREIETRADRELSISAVYTTLQRLEQKGLVRTRMGEPLPERGGRRRKYVELLPAGARALKVAYSAFAGMTAGVEQRLKAL